MGTEQGLRALADAVQAADDLNAAVYRKVFGLEPVNIDGGWYEAEPWLDTDATGTPFPRPLRDYCSDMNAAWAVVAELAAHGHRLFLEDCRYPSGGDGWCAMFDLDSGHDTGTTVAPTAAEAICRAALKVPAHELNPRR